ncbi:MAG TPA: ABC transporter permease [Pedococcus sp.]|jgi:peptide/nickel transport system permease protein|nr:ABC transporter permease [Pedococcus sp.]
MLRLVLRRLAWSVPLLLIASVVSFVFVALLPGDPARALLGQNATQEQVTAVREQLGLDQPLWEQYWNWLRGALHGDFGSSLFTHQPVTQLLNDRLEPSLSLIVGATLVATLVGVVLGVRGARRGALGRVVDAVSIVGIAIPDFWLGLMLIVLFAVQWSLLPPTGYVPFVDDPAGWLTSIVLPVVTLAVPATAIIAKQTRDAVSAAFDRGFVRTLRAAGLSDRSITYRHALKNAAIPILTVVGLVFIGALSGTVAVESIFAIPGLGRTAVQATSSADLPLVQGVVVYFTLIVIVVNLLVDLAYGYFDPRVRQA